jgi:hypothetical protein
MQNKAIEQFKAANLEVYSPLHEWIEGLIFAIGERIGEESLKPDHYAPFYDPESWLEPFKDGKFVAQTLKDGYDFARTPTPEWSEF